MFLMYLLRWQLSSPILYLCLVFLPINNTILSTIIANFIGGCIFFYVDKLILTKKGV